MHRWVADLSDRLQTVYSLMSVVVRSAPGQGLNGGRQIVDDLRRVVQQPFIATLRHPREPLPSEV